MEYDRNAQIWKVCAKEGTRYGMPVVRFNAERQRLEATDGKMAALVPVESCEGDHDGLISPQALQAARKAAPRNGSAVLVLNGEARVPLAGQSFERPEESPFPDIESVLPTEAPLLRFGINAAQLSMLAQAIGAEDGVVTIEIHGSDLESIGSQPFGVRSQSSQAFGLIMPIQID